MNITTNQIYINPDMVQWGRPIVIDFESYYDKEWSLSKITTEKYIRGEQWECIGVSIKDGFAAPRFYRYEEGLSVIAELMEREPLRPFVSHNNSFDMGVLGLRYNLHPLVMVDTTIMAKLCGLDRVAGGVSLAKLSEQLTAMDLVQEEKGTTVHSMLGVHAADMTEEQWDAYEAYCLHDAQLCYALYHYMFDKVPVEELLMASLTTKMFTQPMFDLDTALLEQYAVDLEQQRGAMLGRIASTLNFVSNEALLSHLRSSKKFTCLLESLGVEVPVKWSEKKQEYIPAVSKTDLAFLELLEHDNELVRILVETKLGTMSNMEQTRTATFLDVASRGLCPIPLRYAAAHTGRYGGTDKLNFQNLSKRTKDPVLRRSMRAKPNHVVLASDSSQIEARLLAYIANQEDVVNVFLANEDVYINMATKIYGESYADLYEQSKGANATKEGKTKRNIAKAVVLGAGYGAGAVKFAELMKQQGLAEQADMAEELIYTYRTANKYISGFWKTCDYVLEMLHAGGQMWFGGPNNRLFFADGASEFHGVRIPSILLPNGTYLWYQNLRKETGSDGKVNFVYDQFKGRSWLTKRVWGSVLTENCTQALAFTVLKHQALTMAKMGVPINLNVHDEWVSVVPKDKAGAYALVHYKAMKSVPPYIPAGLLDCEVDVGLNYSDLQTIKTSTMELYV